MQKRRREKMGTRGWEVGCIAEVRSKSKRCLVPEGGDKISCVSRSVNPAHGIMFPAKTPTVWNFRNKLYPEHQLPGCICQRDEAEEHVQSSGRVASAVGADVSHVGISAGGAIYGRRHEETMARWSLGAKELDWKGHQRPLPPLLSSPPSPAPNVQGPPFQAPFHRCSGCGRELNI